MHPKRKTKIVLGSAAEWVEPGPFEPWFKNREKLIRAALKSDYLGRELKRLIRKLVGDLALRDEAFRADLAQDLREIAKGKSCRPKAYTDGFRMQIFTETKVFKESGIVKTLPEAFAKSAELHRSEYPDLSEDAIRGIYQRELRRIKKHKTP